MNRLAEHFTPESYQLALTVDRHAGTIRGTVTILGVPRSPEIALHAKGLRVENVALDGQNIKFVNFADLLRLELPTPPGELIKLTITYSTNINRDMQSCYLSTFQYDGHEELIAATQFESHYARECFPCIDEPGAKATFDLTLTVPDLEPGDVVLANTPLLEHKGRRFRFATTPRMSTYLLAWVIGKFHCLETVNASGVRIASYCAINQPLESVRFANECAARALEYYDARFGRPYPLEKLDQVALPDFEAGAMENWGLVTYRESMMLAAADAPLDLQQSVALTVTHELSHQWFGNLVTMQWWDDLWLNEAFASIMEYYCTDALYPHFQIWENYYLGTCVSALRRDALPGVQSVRQDVSSPAEIATLFDGAIVYSKGARLVLMLIRLMGEENFNRGIRDYFQSFQYRNTVGDDLWHSLQPYADFDVQSFMHAWISQPGYPALSRIALGQPAGEKRNLEQRFLLAGESQEQKQWPISAVLDDMSGHYLLRLAADEFADRLAHFSELSLEQRLRLLIDRSLLARTPAVPAVSLLELIPKFVTEQSPAVWGALQTLISDLKVFCPAGSHLESLYRQFLRETFAPRFAELSFDRLSDYTAIKLRDALVNVALYAEDTSVLSSLVALYRDDLAAIDPELRPAVLIACIKTQEQRFFPIFLSAYQATADPELRSDLLSALAGYARLSAHLPRLIALLGQPQIVRPGDHIFLFVHLLSNPAARARALAWLVTHWEDVKKLTGDKSLEDYLRYAANFIRTSVEAEKLFRFFDSLAGEPAIQRALEIAHAEIPARLQLIERGTPAIRARLQQIFGLPTSSAAAAAPTAPRQDPKLSKMAIVAGGILRKGTKVLLVREASERHYGQWSIPAARVEARESIPAAARRAVLQECGLEVELTGLCAVTEHKVTNALIFSFTTEITGGDLRPGRHEVLDVQWFTPRQISQLAANHQLRDTCILLDLHRAQTAPSAPVDLICTIPAEPTSSGKSAKPAKPAKAAKTAKTNSGSENSGVASSAKASEASRGAASEKSAESDSSTKNAQK